MHRISPFYANIFYYFRQRHTAIFVPQLIHPPELGGRDAGVLLELLAERKTVRIPQLEGQLLQRQIAAQQQRLGAVDPDANGVLPHGDSGGSPELLPQGFIAQIHLGGNLLPGDPPGVALHETHISQISKECTPPYKFLCISFQTSEIAYLHILSDI